MIDGEDRSVAYTPQGAPKLKQKGEKILKKAIQATQIMLCYICYINLICIFNNTSNNGSKLEVGNS